MLNTIDQNLKTLVLIDINMPVMSGFEFLSIYENAIAYQDHSFSVSLLTSSEDADDFIHAQKYPSVLEYLIKPLTVDKLEKLMATIGDKYCVAV